MSKRRYECAVRIGICCAWICAIHAAQASILFSYNGFSSTSGLSLVGNTTPITTGDGTVLRLTGAAVGQSGAAYGSVPVPLGSNNTFGTTFQFRLSSAGGYEPADGFTFVLSTSSSGLGGGGGDLGYEGVASSIAIEFDTYSNGAADGNSSNHIAIDKGGALTDSGLSNVYGISDCDFAAATLNTRPGCLSNGNLWATTIEYDGAHLTVTVMDPAEGSSFTAINNYAIDLASILGQNTAFVGFTSSTGAGFENQDIVNWQFSNTAQLASSVPEPANLMLMPIGFLTLTWFVCRASRRAVRR